MTNLPENDDRDLHPAPVPFQENTEVAKQPESRRPDRRPEKRPTSNKRRPRSDGRVVDRRSGELVYLAPRNRGGSCFVQSLLILCATLIVLVAIFVALPFLGLREFRNSVTDPIGKGLESLGKGLAGVEVCLVDCGDDVTVIDEGPIIAAIDKEAWFEGARQTDNIPQLTITKPWPVDTITGDRSLRYNAFVEVTAGVDFELIDDVSSVIVVDGRNITITLPPPQVRECVLDETNSFYYDRQCEIVGVVSACGELEDELRQAAIAAAANADHEELLEEAFEETADFVKGIIRATNTKVEKITVLMGDTPISQYSDQGLCTKYARPETLQ